ncbi:MAG TPA: CHRD domain-containing protein [Blastocatellia bacterium]|nr:CHRD domain-containing protein [Blastocatellia bacterium]
MKKQLWNVSLIIGLLMAIFAFSVSAYDGIKLRAKLVGEEEVPVVSTRASGEFEARIESDTEISYKLSYEGLEGGNVLFAHIHLGQNNVNGGVMTFLCGGGTKPTACPGPSGTVEGTIRAADILGLGPQQVPAGGFEEFVRALHNGNAYVNVHTTASPGGEIRGQVRDNNGRRKGDDSNDH